MKISHKLTLGIVTMAILIGAVEYVSVRMSRDALQDSIGDNALRLAQKTMDDIDEKIYVRAEEMQVFQAVPQPKRTGSVDPVDRPALLVHLD